MKLNNILNSHILNLKLNNKYNLWISKGKYVGFTYKKSKAHCLMKYTDMNDNNIYFDEITNNFNYLNNIYSKSIICSNIVPIFDLVESIYLPLKNKSKNN